MNIPDVTELAARILEAEEIVGKQKEGGDDGEEK